MRRKLTLQWNGMDTSIRKQIIFFFILLFSFSVFAQSSYYKLANGYRDTYWGEGIWELQKSKPILRPVDIPGREGDRSLYMSYEEDIIMSERTNVFYFFDKNYLKTISYTITFTPETEKKLIQKFQKDYLFYKIDPLEINEEEIKEPLLFDDVWITENYPEGNTVIKELIKRNSKEGDGTLYIINYNELTRVYIYSNIIKGKIVVVYTEAYQEKF